MISKIRLYNENNKGFSLVELIVVVAILAILAALLVPRVAGNVINAENTREVADARKIAGEVSSFNAIARINGTSTIPDPLPPIGNQELTKAMLDSTILGLPDEDSFPDNSIVKIMIDSEGMASIDY